MRNRTTLTVILFGLIIGISGAAYVKDKAKAQRHPSSVGDKKIWMPTPLGKHLALLKVEITSPESIPEAGSDEVTLTGRILVNQELQGDLSYSWSLPEDVQVVDGQVSDSFSNVKNGQIVEVKITVSGFNKEKQRLISLQASGKKGAEVLGNSAVVASRPEDTWEAVAPEMRQAAEAQLGTSKSDRGQ
ncbi:MAG: hypothetical protein KUL82_14025 [Bdellovibrio sp.]|nr:hypothetical protein [Bdellovibrio sp.]